MHKTIRLAAILLAALMTLSALCFAACSEKDPQDDQNPIVLKYKDLKLRKYCFDNLYATNDNYYKMSQGAISMSDYFEMIRGDLARYAVTLKAARDKEYQLTEEDEANIAADRDAQYEHIKSVFMEKVDSSITDEAAVQAEFERLFELDTGYSSELYLECLEESLRDRELIKKYFDEMTDGIEPEASDVRSFLDLQINTQSQWAFSTFAQKYLQFAKGESDTPSLFVPKECFTVVQYLIPEGEEEDEAEKTMQSQTAEELLSGLFAENNGAEEMGSALFRGMGYPMHETITENYSKEFVFAAYRAAGYKMAPGMLPVDFPEFETFKTSDGRDIIKVIDEEGVHYVMMLKRLRKGNITYSEGDEIWQYGYEGAKQKLRQDTFDAAIEKEYKEAEQRHRFTWYLDRFKDKYIPTFNID